MKKKFWGYITLLVFAIGLIVMPWIMDLLVTLNIENNASKYEFVEAEILEAKVRLRSDHMDATIGYMYNGEYCFSEVLYYNMEDDGRDSIQIAINKETGKIYRPGIHFSYRDIAMIFVAICLICLIFVYVADYRKYREQAAIKYAKKLYQRQQLEDDRKQ